MVVRLILGAFNAAIKSDRGQVCRSYSKGPDLTALVSKSPKKQTKIEKKSAWEERKVEVVVGENKMPTPEEISKNPQLLKELKRFYKDPNKYRDS